MSDTHDFDEQIDDLVDRYLLFLRGKGPEPDLGHLTAPQRKAMRVRLDIVDALADRGPARPALHEDPVAMRLGLVPDRRPGPDPGSDGDGAPPTSAAESETALDPVQRVLDELHTGFAGQVTIDWTPPWRQWRTAEAAPLAQCSALGVVMALFVTDETDWEDEPVQLASFLRQHPQVSSVTLVSRDAARAAIYSAAACNHAIDPVRGWLEPGAFVVTDSFELTLRHYFEQRLPRWDRVSDLTEILETGDITADALEVVTDEIDAELRTRPRLEHKRRALQALRLVKPVELSALIVAAHAGTLSTTDLVDRVSALSEGTP
jgi:hypothetical protein